MTCFDTLSYTYDNNGRVIKEEYSSGDTTEYVYDKCGNLTKQTLTVTGNEKTTTTVTTYTYDELGNMLSSKCDNDKSSYIYDAAGRNLFSNENGNYTRTLYDEYGRTVQEIGPEDYDRAKDGLPDKNTYADSNVGHRYEYNKNNQLIGEINRHGVETLYEYYSTGEKKIESFDIYDFCYNKKGSITKVYAAGVNTVSYNYDDNNNLISEVYANGDSIRYKYDNNGNVIAQYHNDDITPYAEYAYNKDNVLEVKYNSDTDLGYVYGENGDNSVDVLRLNEGEIIYSYKETVTEADEKTNTEARTDITETHFGTTYSSVIKDKSVSYTLNSDTAEYSYESDDSDRIISDSVKYNDNTVSYSKYTYDDKGNIINKDIIINDASYPSIINEYDSKGRMIASGYDKATEYFTYDDNSQLVRVDESSGDFRRTSTYTYDERGNITSKNVYNYTPNENITESPKQTTTFTYSNNSWIDQLIAVNGVELTYDANGNVLTYGDREFTWNTGRYLESITDGNNKYSYTYDENGIRTSKTVNGVTTYYNTKDGVILSQSDGTNTMYFQYDSNGIPLGFVYNGIQYFYVTNQMGDVLGITDKNGEIIAGYEYDEWGNVLRVAANNKTDQRIANANPIRYRGYYYDNETGYYYLQSRYYDPSICRFINSDLPEYAKTQKCIYGGVNLFAYCCNFPVNNIDSSGNAVSKTYKKYGYIWGNTTKSNPDIAIVYLYYNGSKITEARFGFWKSPSKDNFKGCMTQFDNRKSYAKKISDYCLFYPLAQAIYSEITVRYGKSKFSERTVNGVFVELIIHYALYSMNILRESKTNTTEIGDKGNGVDKNAKYFESIAAIPNAVSDMKNGNQATIKKYANQVKGKL